MPSASRILPTLFPGFGLFWVGKTCAFCVCMQQPVFHSKNSKKLCSLAAKVHGFITITYYLLLLVISKISYFYACWLLSSQVDAYLAAKLPKCTFWRREA